MAMVTGELDKDEQERKTERDLRTLYIRFKEAGPTDEEEIMKLDKTIKLVRIPRQGKAKEKKDVRYCFVEFSDEAECEAAKDILASNPNHYVDFVGVKSKAKQSGLGAKQMPINPTRLHVSGLVEGVTEEKLKSLFPKSVSAIIPKGSIRKGGVYGFVQFGNPGDAKAAFDAANKLKVEGSEKEGGATHLTVLFARVSRHAPTDENSEEQKEGAEKRPSDTKNGDSPKKKVKKNNGDGVESDENNDE